jgi:hypothetical protein
MPIAAVTPNNIYKTVLSFFSPLGITDNGLLAAVIGS